MNRDNHYYFGGASNRQSAINYAASRACRGRNEWVVYGGKHAFYVRPASEPAPEFAEFLCRATFLDNVEPYDMVQLHYADGKNEIATF